MSGAPPQAPAGTTQHPPAAVPPAKIPVTLGAAPLSTPAPGGKIPAKIPMKIPVKIPLKMPLLPPTGAAVAKAIPAPVSKPSAPARAALADDDDDDDAILLGARANGAAAAPKAVVSKAVRSGGNAKKRSRSESSSSSSSSSSDSDSDSSSDSDSDSSSGSSSSSESSESDDARQESEDEEEEATLLDLAIEAGIVGEEPILVEEQAAPSGPPPRPPVIRSFPSDIDAALERYGARLNREENAMRIKDDTKSVSLGTSKVNYIDPRIICSWATEQNVPINKIFTTALQKKFPWAMASTEFRF